jgi:RimJ/RimL family protein N-acetyltransferase
MLFETERLIVRRLTHSDGEAMAAIYGDAETVQFVGDSIPLSLDECLRWVDVTDTNFHRRGYGMVAFCMKDSGELIGCGGLVHPDQQVQAEVKYAFRRDFWGQGFATEAISGLIQFARINWKVGRVIATVAPGNTPSQKVLSKLGFTWSEDQLNDDNSITQVWVIESQALDTV